MDGGESVEERTPEHLFQSPREDRTKLFLSQVLQRSEGQKRPDL